MGRLFHIATVADWEEARASGRYTTSTRGRTLAEEGYIHASRGDQWQGVRERWYADVTEPLVLLVIDPDLLASPVVEEEVPGGEVFPHVYGPINPDAVVQTIALEPPAPTGPAVAPRTPVAVAPAPGPAPTEASFSRVYLTEVFRSTLVASFVLAVVVAATFAGMGVQRDWGPLVGAVLGLVAGVLAARWWGRR